MDVADLLAKARDDSHTSPERTHTSLRKSSVASKDAAKRRQRALAVTRSDTVVAGGMAPVVKTTQAAGGRTSTTIATPGQPTIVINLPDPVINIIEPDSIRLDLE